MGHYLFQGNYSPDSWKNLVTNPQDRSAPVVKLLEAAGGS